MNKIKRLLCIGMVIGIILSSTAGFASNSFVSDLFLDNKNISAEQWFKSKDSRSLCTIMTAIGIVKNSNDLIFEDLKDYLSNPSWIGISKSKEQIITIGYLGDSKITVYIAIVTPKTGKIEYTTMDMSSSKKEDIPKILESIIPSVLAAQAATSEYFENDLEIIDLYMKQLYGEK